MTTSTEQHQEQPTQEGLSLSWQQMALVRIRPADLARLLGVSRQTVSRWISDGIVTQFPDGRLDPVRAVREVIERGNPKTIRARIIRQAMQDMQLKTENAIAAKDEEIAALHAEADRKAEWTGQVECTVDRLVEMLAERRPALMACASYEEALDMAKDMYFEAFDSCEGSPGHSVYEGSGGDVDEGVDG